MKVSRHQPKLTEGMRAGDLKDLVLPLISVDEYESKIDSNEALVIGFYVHDKDAANDLNRFLQKSSVATLDTDVSPAPDQHGYFLVFVELLKNDKVVDIIVEILKDVEPLVSITNWSMRVRQGDGVVDFEPDALTKALSQIKEKATDEDVLEFICNSDLDAARIDEEGLLILEGNRSTRAYAVLGFGLTEEVVERLSLTEGANLSLREALRAERLERLLGAGWIVTEVQKILLLSRFGSKKSLAIR